MIKLPKKVVFILFALVTVLFGISISNFNWQVFQTNSDLENIYKEVREPFMLLILAVFFILYYVQALKREKNSK